MRLETAAEVRRRERANAPKKIRYSVTCIHRDGYRKFALSALWASDMWDTREEAEAWLSSALADSSNVLRLEQIHGKQAYGTYRVDPFECWEHGEPVGCYPIESSSTQPEGTLP